MIKSKEEEEKNKLLKTNRKIKKNNLGKRKMNKKKTILLSMGLILIIIFASFSIFIYSFHDEIEVNAWKTISTKEDVRLVKINNLKFSPSSKFYSFNSKSILINDNIKYQKMKGFGAALTDSSAWLLHEVLDETEYQETMRKIFDPIEGIGLSFIRIPIGSTDCALKYYNYDNTPPNLDDFSISHDLDYIIPVLQDALSLNPGITIIASPWSPPGWMKINNNLTDPSTLGMIGGQLNPDMYQIYAEYLAKFIKSYHENNININAITIQNEQFFVPEDYPGMYMGVDETINFVKILQETFEKEEITTDIFILDHNWDYVDEVLDILNDDDANNAIDGIAWHGYGEPTPEKQDDVHDQFPDKMQYFTEISPLSDYTYFPDNLAWTYHYVIVGSIRNWGQAIAMWNLVLDQNGGPIFTSDHLRGVITIPQENGTRIGDIKFDGEFWMLGHLSKFIAKDAVRIKSNNFPNEIENIAFQNPDGSIVLVLCNLEDEDQDVQIYWDYRQLELTIEGRSLITLQWTKSG